VEALPRKPRRKGTPCGEVAETGDCPVRRLQLKEKGGELRSGEAPSVRWRPEVDFVEGTPRQILVPSEVGDRDRSNHSMYVPLAD
jgi:hypothetical protein